MIDLLFKIVVVFFALITFLTLILRLNSMTWITHQGCVVAMHIGMALACAWAIHEAIFSTPSVGSLGSVIASFCWLIYSVPSWRDNKPPKHSETKPGELFSDTVME